MKKCITCKKILQLDKFSFRNKKKNLRNSVCKVCHNKYTKNHYHKNKKEYTKRARVNSKKYRIENRKKMIEYLTDKQCVDCKENDIRVLDFDHINPSKKYKSVSKMMGDYSWNKILDEIDKCVIRCANCHRKVTSAQFFYYKSQ